ncbi:MAG: GtrA family protein [Bacteroides sp.]|nr:GtrA family protein [Bacteroides sp.]MBD5371080.1 GtrA family protein [Bacteroides sp.]
MDIKKVGDKLLHNDNLLFTFLRSAVSSQTSGWTDFAVSFVFFAWVHLSAWVATAIGALAGGIVNCVINYRFTFHADGVDWKAVVVKYVMVWIGSLLLNSFGTELLFWLIQDWDWLETIGFKHDGYFAAARLFVALIVSWGWNFIMQRYFVYRVTRFDPYAIRFVDLILPRLKKVQPSDESAS